MDINNSILIIGPPDSGKTTFQAQLYTKIQSGIGQVKLIRTPDNIKAIQSACDRLAEGKETQTTPANENVEVIIPVEINGDQLDLVCKDYGGEQVRNITELMAYDENWLKRAKSNDRWVLFIRSGQIYNNYDLGISGYAEMDKEGKGDPVKNELSSQYNFIELLQALLHARGRGIKSKINNPKLLIVLTCWDELETKAPPREELISKMPLFNNFLNSIWEKNSIKIIGLSAQEFSLDNEAAQNKYLEELPESFGYIIQEDNSKENDITKLIEIALGL